jgi:5-formyltetrahydrofolate cyclo-ligase
MSYDRNGFRIGYGGGFYDRYFSKLKELTMRQDKCLFAVGAVYHTFLEQELPHDELDVAVDIVVTDKEFIFLA